MSRSGTTLRQDASPGRSSTSESTRPCRPGSSLIFSRCSPIFQGPWRSDCQHLALPEPLHEYQLLFLPVLIVALIVTAIAIGAPWMPGIFWPLHSQPILGAPPKPCGGTAAAAEAMIDRGRWGTGLLAGVGYSSHSVMNRALAWMCTPSYPSGPVSNLCGVLGGTTRTCPARPCSCSAPTVNVAHPRRMMKVSA